MKWVDELASNITGQVLSDEATLSSASTDFGHILERKPAVVVRPAWARDVAETIKFAGAHGLRAIPRGAGHSQNGLSLSDDIQLDLTSLDQVIRIDAERQTVTCQAGITWRALLGRLYPMGLSPIVLTNNLDVTVGGTLSTAGLGVASWRHGAQTGHCLELEAATSEGDIVHCSSHSNTDLFDALRCGVGCFGVITEATIQLRRHLSRYQTFYLLYDDIAALHRDLVTLMDEERFHYLEGWCRPLPNGLRKVGGVWNPFSQWFFPLHCTLETDHSQAGFERDAAPVVTGAISEKFRGLNFYKHTHTEEGELIDFFSRLDPLFDLWKAGGFWDLAHPWMECILPWDLSPSYIERVIDLVPPQLLAGGHIILWPARGTTPGTPLFVHPAGKHVMGFGVLPSIPDKMLPRVLPVLKQASAAAEKMGGKRYISGWLDFDANDWETHFGALWPLILELKGKFDPKGVFSQLPM